MHTVGDRMMLETQASNLKSSVFSTTPGCKGTDLYIQMIHISSSPSILITHYLFIFQTFIEYLFCGSFLICKVGIIIIPISQVFNKM